MIPVGVLLVILGALHSSNAAQADAWARMERLLRPGDQLIVESLAGSAAAGALVEVDVGRIAIWSDGHTREFARNEVSRVTRLRRTNGRAPLIGALVGGGIGAGLAASYQDFDPGGRLLITGIGAGAGAGLGVLVGRRRVREIVYLGSPESFNSGESRPPQMDRTGLNCFPRATTRRNSRQRSPSERRHEPRP